MEETFTYDHLNRLTDIRLNGAPTGHMSYDALGRMTDKQSDGQQVFSSAQHDYIGPDGQLRPHAVSSAQTGDGFPQAGIQSIDYTMFDKVSTMTYNGSNHYVFEYGYDHQRTRMTATNGGILMVNKDYVGSCEFVRHAASPQLSFTYLSGPMGVFAMVEKEGATEQVQYILKDHLGSYTAITDDDGELVLQQSFDAWGNRRNPSTWTGNAAALNFHDRGFTGHEHLFGMVGGIYKEIGLINMNGRMYDPIMSSFLSVDNYVQAPDFSQSFNRYAYCLNNPLKYTDPDGEIALTTLAMVGIGIATVMGGYTGYNIAVSKGYGFDDWQTYGYMLGGAAIGFAAGYTGAYLVAGGGFMANTAGVYASSLVNCTGMTMLSGGSYSPPISFGAVSYDPMTGEWGYLGKEGNSPLQNLGYGFGALANLQDIVAGVNGTNIQVKSRKELAGHSEFGSYSDNGYYQDGDILVSVGPNVVVGSSDHDVLLAMENKISIPTDDGVAWELPFVKATLKGKSVSGINEQLIFPNESQFTTTINNVNGKILHNMTNNLNAGRNLINTGNLKYGLLYGCVNYTSRALAMSGVLNVNALLPVTAPVLLNLELAIRNLGIYASPYLIQY